MLSFCWCLFGARASGSYRLFCKLSWPDMTPATSGGCGAFLVLSDFVRFISQLIWDACTLFGVVGLWPWQAFEPHEYGCQTVLSGGCSMFFSLHVKNYEVLNNTVLRLYFPSSASANNHFRSMGRCMLVQSGHMHRHERHVEHRTVRMLCTDNVKTEGRLYP